MIEVIFSAPALRAAAFWKRGEAAWQYWFSEEEITALATRKNRTEATLARLLVKCAVRSALRRAGMLSLPAAKDLRIAVEPGGRPWIDMPESCVDWLNARGMGLDVSLSHTRDRAMAMVVIA